MRLVHGYAIINVTRSEQTSVFEKEGTKGKKTCLTKLVAENLSCLSPHERERDKVDRKHSQELGTCTASDFKVATRMSFTRDEEATIEDAALIEKTFGPDIGGLKGMTTRSKPLPTQIQTI